MFLWWSSTKIVQAIWIRQKTWPPGGWAYFPYIIYIENFQNLLVRNHWTDFYIILQKCSFGDPSLRLFKRFGFIKRHGAETHFNIILQKCSFGDPLPRLFKPFGFVKKHGRQGAGGGERGLFSLYIYIEKFKNLLVRKQWTNFNIPWRECCFGDPQPRLFKLSWFFKKHGC